MKLRLIVPLIAMACVLLGPAAAAQAPLLVDAEWLEAHLGDGNLRIVDMVTERNDYRRGHIPGAVYLNVDDIRPVTHADLLGRMLLASREIAEKLGVIESGYRLVINNGRDAGESVPHLHIHLLAGRPLHWPPG